jgi:hypothetical protein
LFEKARDVYEEGMTTVITVRDFSMIFDALTQFEESLISAKMENEADAEDEEGADPEDGGYEFMLKDGGKDLDLRCSSPTASATATMPLNPESTFAARRLLTSIPVVWSGFIPLSTLFRRAPVQAGAPRVAHGEAPRAAEQRDAQAEPTQCSRVAQAS